MTSNPDVIQKRATHPSDRSLAVLGTRYLSLLSAFFQPQPIQPTTMRYSGRAFRSKRVKANPWGLTSSLAATTETNGLYFESGF